VEAAQRPRQDHGEAVRGCMKRPCRGDAEADMRCRGREKAVQ
jgi:hypothetical protein